MRLVQYSDIENVHDDPKSVGRLAGTIQSLQGEDALVCGTGDNTAPGVLPLVTRGEIALDFFDAARPDLETFGNHDFDFGPDRTAELVRRSPQRWLSANVSRNGEPFAGVDRWAIERIGDERIGFFGVTDPTTPSIGASEGDPVFSDPIEAAERTVGALRERGVDHVVVLSHLGRADDRLAVACDIDAILGGHVHTERIERIEGTLLTRPGSGGETVLEVDLQTGAVERHVVASGPTDSELVSRYETRLSAAGLDEVVGHVEEPIARTDRETYQGESRIGNFVADAYRWAAERAVGTEPPVVGLQNSGGIRTGPALSGSVTTHDLIGLVPFDEVLVVAELTGSELRAIFEEGAAVTGFGEAEWWHAHVSGARITYSYDDSRLLDATVAGESIVDDRQYRLAVSEFLLHTEVEFPTLEKRHVIERLQTQYDVLIEYARTVGIDPVIEGRISRVGL